MNLVWCADTVSVLQLNQIVKFSKLRLWHIEFPTTIFQRLHVTLLPDLIEAKHTFLFDTACLPRSIILCWVEE
ncbi:hypothetical protein VNO80_23148 [Phaseolus coccineus]|uniref:Uncharacterized protein n=1 Tax=Phaseolus coccineus TaxID=3886 RepID=A0AAN9QUQ3_PHACN